jgi:hypothetical protein
MANSKIDGKKKNKWIEKHPISRQLHIYRSEAKQRGLVFELVLSDFVSLPQKGCVYCGHPASGFDRVDNSCGYLRSNVVPCCRNCNRAKSDLDQKSFIALCHRVAQRHPLVKSEIDRFESYEQVMFELRGEF